MSSADANFLHFDWWMPASHLCKAPSYFFSKLTEVFHTVVDKSIIGDFCFSMVTRDFYVGDSPILLDDGHSENIDFPYVGSKL